jgi:hypothetical protein
MLGIGRDLPDNERKEKVEGKMVQWMKMKTLDQKMEK